MSEYHRLEVRVLRALEGGQELRIEDLAASLDIPAQSAFYGASLLVDKGLARIRQRETSSHVLTERGNEALDLGLPEELLMEGVCSVGQMPVKDALALLDKEVASIALGQAKKQGLIEIKGGMLKPTPQGTEACQEHPLRNQLARIQRGEEPGEDPTELLARGLIEAVRRTERFVSLSKQGIEASKSVQEESEIVDLEPEMIRTGSWKDGRFKRFDIAAPAPTVYPAKKQPYRRFLDHIRRKLVSLGFVEMTGPLVELAFWNFDALFQAQNHPAREVHDTFTIKTPSLGSLPREEYVDKVKQTHENGWKTGSSGWGYEWSMEEASRLVARSQGTALSARTLAAGIDPPAKHFSIARIFRPDVLDRTHLIEFNQCEGIIADEALTFRHLLGVLRMFAVEIANEENFALVPSYYPFTEPSVDLVAYSEEQGDWVELGGAGIFREEVTQPLGVDIPVIAWGMGIDRLAMFSLGIGDIRELFSQNLSWLREGRVVI